MTSSTEDVAKAWCLTDLALCLFLTCNENMGQECKKNKPTVEYVGDHQHAKAKQQSVAYCRVPLLTNIVFFLALVLPLLLA